MGIQFTPQEIAFRDENRRFIGQQTVQLHGGMEMTDELAVGHYFKRLTMIPLGLNSSVFKRLFEKPASKQPLRHTPDYPTDDATLYRRHKGIYANAPAINLLPALSA